MSSKQSSPSILSINTEELKKLVDRRNNGNPPSDGWGIYEVDCPGCRSKLAIVVMIGTRGLICPRCNYTDKEYSWLTSSFIGGDLNYLNPVAFEKTEFIVRN